MKITHLFSKIMLIAACITTSIHANNVYLSNNSSYNIEFKFTEPNRIVDEKFIIQLPIGTEFDLGSINNINDTQHISIRRSGMGSSFSSWTELPLDQLKTDMKNFLAARPKEDVFNQNFRWSITRSLTEYNWNVKTIGFRTVKK